MLDAALKYMTDLKMAIGPSVKEEGDSEGYNVYVLTRQVFVPEFKSILKYYYAKGQFSSYTAMRSDPHFSDVYQGVSKNLYKPGSPVNKLFSSIFLPKEARGAALGPKATAKLEEVGAGYLRISKGGGQIMNIGWLVFDFAALGRCFMNGGCSTGEVTVVTADVGRLSLSIYSAWSNIQGLAHLASARIDDALKYLTIAQRVEWKIGGFQFVVGMTRLVMAVNDYVETGEANGSDFFYSSIDSFSGVAQVARAKYVLQVAKATDDVATAAKTLAFTGVRYTAILSRFLQFAGSIGAAVGVGVNAMTLYDALNDPYMSESERTKAEVSSSMGIAGGVLLVASGFVVVSASVPIGIALAVGGMAVIAVQTLYEIFWE